MIIKINISLYYKPMRSISSFVNRPLSLVIVILFDLPVVLSTAETYKKIYNVEM
jgi:hypothetical protein